MKKLEFISGMKKLSSFYLKEFTNEQLSLWYEMFEDIPEDIFNQAVKVISKDNKYMPNASELYDKCSHLNKNNLMEVIDYMYKDGYFNHGVKRLSDEQALRNYEKAMMWIEKGIIPSFLKEDMLEYMKKMKQPQIKDKGRIQIEC